MGYPLGAWLTGYLMERSVSKSALASFWSIMAGSLVILTMGACWLSRFIGFERALLLGVAPFVVGDIFKSLFAVKAAKLLGRTALSEDAPRD